MVRLKLANDKLPIAEQEPRALERSSPRRTWTLAAKEIPSTPEILGDMAAGVGKANV